MMTEVDAVKEAADARAWEELNAEPDPHAKKAADLLTKAADALKQVVDLMIEAADEVENSPETHRVSSLGQAVEDLEISIREQIRRFEE